MRLVFDTNVVASALLWQGPPRSLLLAARGGRVAAFTSTPMLAELTDILGRRKFDRKIAASGLGIDRLVDSYAELASVVRPASLTGTAPDPDDDVVIATGVAANASFIVTGDKALLSVVQYHGVRIVDVGHVLELLLR